LVCPPEIWLIEHLDKIIQNAIDIIDLMTITRKVSPIPYMDAYIVYTGLVDRTQTILRKNMRRLTCLGTGLGVGVRG
jgi:hypothetical protein